MNTHIVETLRSKKVVPLLILTLFCVAVILLYERTAFERRLKTVNTDYLNYYSKYMQCEENQSTLSKNQYSQTSSAHRKTIQDVTYAIQNDAPNSTYLHFGTINDSGLFTRYDQVDFSPYLSTNIIDFWFDQKNQTLFLITSQGQNDTGGVELISSISIKQTDVGQIPQFKFVYAKTDFDAYASSNILDYDPIRQQLLLTTIGGDGCGGYGSIWSVSIAESKHTEFARTEFGCNKAHPRFAGYIEKKLYFITAQPDIDRDHVGPDVYTELFAIDPNTKQKESVLVDMNQFAGLTVAPPLQYVEVQKAVPSLTSTELVFARYSENKTEYFGFDVHTKVLRPL